MKVFLNILVLVTFLFTLIPTTAESNQASYQALIKEYKAAVASKDPARIKAAQKKLNASKGAVKYMKKHNPGLHKHFATKVKAPEKARLAKVPKVVKIERVGGGKLPAGAFERGDAVQIRIGKKQEAIIHPDGKVSTSKPVRAPRQGESVGKVPVEYTTRDIPGAPPDSTAGKGSSGGGPVKSRVTSSGKSSSPGGSGANLQRSKPRAAQAIGNSGKAGSLSQRTPGAKSPKAPSRGIAKSKSMATGPEPAVTKIGKAPEVKVPVGDPKSAGVAKPSKRLSIQEIMARQNTDTPEKIARRLGIGKNMAESGNPATPPKTRQVKGNPSLANIADPANRAVNKGRFRGEPDLARLGRGEGVRTPPSGRATTPKPETRVNPGNANTRVTGAGRAEPGTKTRISSGNTPTKANPIRPGTRVNQGNANTRVTGGGRVEPGTKTRVSTSNTPTKANPIRPETRVNPGNSETRVTGAGRAEPGTKTRISSGNTPTRVTPSGATSTGPKSNPSLVDGKGRASSSLKPTAGQLVGAAVNVTQMAGNASKGVQREREAAAEAGRDFDPVRAGAEMVRTAAGGDIADASSRIAREERQREFDRAQAEGREPDEWLAADRATSRVANEVLNPVAAGEKMGDRIGREEAQIEIERARAAGEDPSATRATVQSARRVVGEMTGMQAIYDNALYDSDADRQAAETARRLEGKRQDAILEMDNGMFDLAEIERKQRQLETNKCLSPGNNCDQESRDWAEERRGALQAERDALRDRLQGINSRLGPDAGANDPEAIAIRQAVRGIDEPVGGTGEPASGTDEPAGEPDVADGGTSEECLTLECLGEQGDKDISKVADMLEARRQARQEREQKERERRAQQGENQGATETGQPASGTGEPASGTGEPAGGENERDKGPGEDVVASVTPPDEETGGAFSGDQPAADGATGEECGTFRGPYPANCQDVGVLDMEVGCRRIIEYSCNDEDSFNGETGQPASGTGQPAGGSGDSGQNGGQANSQVARGGEPPAYDPGLVIPEEDQTGPLPDDPGPIYEPDWDRFDTPPPPPPARDVDALRGSEEDTNRRGGGDGANSEGVRIAMGTNTAGSAMDNVRSRTSGETDDAQRDMGAVQDERTTAAQGAHGAEMESINRQGRQAENAVGAAREQHASAESARQSGRVERDQIDGAAGRGGIEGAAALGASLGAPIGTAMGTRVSQDVNLVEPPRDENPHDNGENRDDESGSSGGGGTSRGCENARSQVSALTATLNKNPGDSAAISSLQTAQKNMESACAPEDDSDTASSGGGRVCTDSKALNYKGNGRCVYRGCMDSNASNYNKDAIEPAECIYGGSDDNNGNANDDNDDCCGDEDGGGGGGGGESHHGGAGITVSSPAAPVAPTAPAPAPPVVPVAPPPPPPTSCGCAKESQCAPCTGGKGRLFPCYECECLGGCY